ncbi:hypothetical protein AVEN_69866-1 [Araneus ventricosus]|uniref:Uncharacterized protein n=1 Tax=Araneus ventricosus TaxID=182803 RepID=A0A4Y2HEY0_ARAVE|nr:hypothetical protein AVEN_69866-1 [Araneus ventricosus]
MGAVLSADTPFLARSGLTVNLQLYTRNRNCTLVCAVVLPRSPIPKAIKIRVLGAILALPKFLNFHAGDDTFIREYTRKYYRGYHSHCLPLECKEKKKKLRMHCCWRLFCFEIKEA